jgi:hypothetical protein
MQKGHREIQRMNELTMRGLGLLFEEYGLLQCIE